MSDSASSADMRLQLARDLVLQLEASDADAANATLDTLTGLREMAIYKEMGKITRELHQALSDFKFDERLALLAEKEMPSATERLNYVIKVTENAANATMDAIEKTMPVSERIGIHSKELTHEWQRFKGRKMTVDEFKTLSVQIENYLVNMSGDSELLQQQLNDVLMAQGFQDITGQIIRHVINLVQEVEDNMVGLIKSGQQYLTHRPELEDRTDQAMAQNAGHAAESASLQGPAIPGVNDADTVSGQDEVDDLLSSLGF